MELDVRTITDDELAAWCDGVNRGFVNATPGGADAESRRANIDLDRTWAGFDGDQVVSTLRSFATPLTVPGGRQVEVSAVTAVTTTVTHRRRGLATRMVHADLAAAAERGEAAAILIAAEYEIYGRFGYGAATEHQTFVFDARQAALRQRPAGTVELVDAETAREHARPVFERHRAARPGEIMRTDRALDISFGLVRYPSWPEFKKSFHVLARDPAGTPAGIARYQVADKYEHRQPCYQLSIEQMITDSPLGAALLWWHFTNLDLVGEVTADDRPADELLPWLLTDARQARVTDRFDMMWLRPLDVPALLSARGYLVPGRLVLEVVDKAGGYAAGRYALAAGTDGATCARTEAPADVTLDAATLGSVYLGGYQLRTLAAAGLVEEHTPGAVSRADAMFTSPVTPWCSTWF
jgi:predicted acetyltransferase